MQLFILLFLLSHVAVVTAVDGCHSDRDKDHRPMENCTAAGFSDIPAGIDPSTEVLLFPKNLFSSLSWSSFQTFLNIYEIDLTGNQVPVVTSSVSPMLPTLCVLRLGSNRLTSLSDGSFSACPGLTNLYLDNNVIDSLSDHTFSGLSKLEILDLSSNHIKVLPELMLHPLATIETILLENNKIKVMPDDWFSQKEEVPYLYLSANLWACTCSLGYLRRYLDDYDYNIYVRDGPLIKSDPESVVCDSPQWYKGKPVISLEESDLCSPTSGPTGDIDQPVITDTPYKTFPSATPIPNTITISPPPPTTTSTPTPTSSVTTYAPSPIFTATPAFTEELYTVDHRVFTWSWYLSFTRTIEWSGHSGSVPRTEVPLTELHTEAIHLTSPAVRPSTESPAHMTTATPTKPVQTTKSVPLTTAPTTPKVQVITSTTPTWVSKEPGGQRRGSGAGVFCFWLFAGCLLLCLVSALCILASLASLVSWYRRVYKPLRLVRRGGGEAVRMLTCSRREEKEVAGEGAVMALYRSVLFIHREGGEAVEVEDGGKEGEVGGDKEGLLVALEPTGRGGATIEEDRRGREERGVYKKTLYRLLSREEELDGWRDVMEECRVSAEDGGRRGGEGMARERSRGGASRKCYSVILREQREEEGGGREELDWVVGGWEVKKGDGGEEGKEPRSSWGEWLAHYLPSMPWGVTTPPEGEAFHG